MDRFHAIAAPGIAVAPDPNREVVASRVTGAVSPPPSGSPVASVEPLDRALALTFADGEPRKVPFDSRFLDP